MLPNQIDAFEIREGNSRMDTESAAINDRSSPITEGKIGLSKS